MKSTKAFTITATPVRASELAGMLEESSGSLNRYLGESIYCNTDPAYLQKVRGRLAETVRLHIKNVGDKPTVLLRAPGRLNAFLEYLDMCAGDHMSTTIDGDIPVCVSFRDDDFVRAFNACRDFRARKFSIIDELGIFRSAPWLGSMCAGLPDNWDSRTRVYPHHSHHRGDWMNYVESAFLRLAWEAPRVDLRGVDMTFGESHVPRRGGTGSSAAVVVISFLAAYLANRDALPRWDISYICKLLGEAEWYVGTHGGANDQTTILLNSPSYVLYNRHSQLQPDSTPLPSLQGVRMILAHSLWEANKSLNARHIFNLRKGWMDLGDDLMRLFIAAICEHLDTGGDTSSGWIGRLISERFGIELSTNPADLEECPQLWNSIRGNYRKFGSLDKNLLCIPNSAIDELINILPEEISAAQASAILGKDAQTLDRDYTLPEPEEGGYRVRAAATFFHKENKIGRMLEEMLLEADRQLSSGKIALDSPEYERYQLRVGRILQQLQKSLREDFQVSNSQLEMLLEIASSGPGYLGGKLTGAGCGGCVVVMVREGKEEAFCDYLDERYYGQPRNFDEYRRRVSQLAPTLASELLNNLESALANPRPHRRVVTFSAGAGALDIAGYFAEEPTARTAQSGSEESSYDASQTVVGAVSRRR